MKKLFNATFEQSLNLEDEKLIKYMQKDIERPGVKEKPILLKVLVMIMIMLLYGIVLLADFSTKYSDKDSFLQKSSINFLPLSLFWLFLGIYVSVWIYTLFKRYDATKFFWAYINCVNILIWLVLELNLLFITFFLESLTVTGMGLIIGLLILVEYVVFKSKKKSLENVLYEIKTKKDKIDELVEKVLKLVMKYGWLIVIAVIVWKFFFPSSDTIKSDIFGFVSILCMWFVCDIGFIVAETYLFFPYLLHGYYKYSEEYREWEDKTQLEWYGEGYYNKHIKGTEKEKKDEQYFSYTSF